MSWSRAFRKDPDAVDLLVESTVANITQILKDMPSEEFVERKKNVKMALEKKEKTLGQEVSKSWSPIWQGHMCFDKKEKMLAKLDKMDDSTDALVDMWAKATVPSADRRKIVVKLFGGEKGAHLSPLNSTRELKSTTGHVHVVTMVDSTNLKKEFKSESYWPDELICE